VPIFDHGQNVLQKSGQSSTPVMIPWIPSNKQAAAAPSGIRDSIHLDMVDFSSSSILTNTLEWNYTAAPLIVLLLPLYIICHNTLPMPK